MNGLKFGLMVLEGKGVSSLLYTLGVLILEPLATVGWGSHVLKFDVQCWKIDLFREFNYFCYTCFQIKKKNPAYL